jgi:hypothetical protein
MKAATVAAACLVLFAALAQTQTINIPQQQVNLRRLDPCRRCCCAALTACRRGRTRSRPWPAGLPPLNK